MISDPASALPVRLVEAIRASWSEATASEPDRWSADRPATGHCEVSSFVLWERVGGDLVMAKVLVDGEQTEHHWWNRIGCVDVDLTREQFHGHEEIVVLRVIADVDVRRRRHELRPELMERVERFRATVDERLAR